MEFIFSKAAGLRHATLLKNELLHIFFKDLITDFRTPFPWEHLLLAACVAESMFKNLEKYL